jgi:hypothetical protein
LTVSWIAQIKTPPQGRRMTLHIPIFGHKVNAMGLAAAALAPQIAVIAAPASC